MMLIISSILLLTIGNINSQSLYQQNMAVKYPTTVPTSLTHPAEICRMYGPARMLTSYSRDVYQDIFPMYPCGSVVYKFSADWSKVNPAFYGGVSERFLSMLHFIEDGYYVQAQFGDMATSRPETTSFNPVGNTGTNIVLGNKTLTDMLGTYSSTLFAGAAVKLRRTPGLVALHITADCSAGTPLILSDPNGLMAILALKSHRYIHTTISCDPFSLMPFNRLVTVPPNVYTNFMIPTAHEWFGDTYVDNLNYSAGAVSMYKKLAWARYNNIFFTRRFDPALYTSQSPPIVLDGIDTYGLTALLNDVRSEVYSLLALDNSDPAIYNFLFDTLNTTQAAKYNNMTLKDLYGLILKQNDQLDTVRTNFTATVLNLTNVYESKLIVQNSTILALSNTNRALMNSLNSTAEVIANCSATISDLQTKVTDMLSCSELVRRVNALNRQVIEEDPVTHRIVYGSYFCLQQCRLGHLNDLIKGSPSV